MTELEKVEKLREKADVSFADAKEALDNSDGDILDALIYLERNGKADAPAGGGYYSGANLPVLVEDYKHEEYGKGSRADNNEDTFSDLVHRLGRFLLKLLNKGNTNHLDAYRGGYVQFSCPVTAFVLLLIFFFWVTIPLMVISLFLGYSYRFRGADLGRESVNSVMDNASSVVDEVKKSFRESTNNENNNEE